MFTRLLKRKRGFTWNTDGEQLLRQHKPRYFDGTVLPRTVVLSEPPVTRTQRSGAVGIAPVPGGGLPWRA